MYSVHIDVTEKNKRFDKLTLNRLYELQFYSF